MKTESPTKVHRVPPSTNKRLPGSGRKEVPHAKRHKKLNKRGGEANAQSSGEKAARLPGSPMDVEPQFQKLDTKDPQEAKRMVQRRKTVSKGKNTAGYDAYIEQVPKDKRRARSMETPMTPDPSLNIPAKRWQGLVRAWYVQHSIRQHSFVWSTLVTHTLSLLILHRRVALHKYDPPDMVNSVSEASETKESSHHDKLANDKKPETLQARELEEAATKGLLVDLGDEQNDALDAISPMSVLTEPTSRTPVRREIDFDEKDGGLENDNDGNDSDDDLL